jgi:hypothetical protein
MKYECLNSLLTLMPIDLAVGTGDSAVQSGDSVEVSYTGWLLKDGAFGKVCVCVCVWGGGTVFDWLF